VSGIPEVSVSAEEYDDLKKKAEERERYWNELLRTKADFENFQKRVRKERPGWEEQAVRRFILDLLPVFDNFERALEHASDSASAEGFERGVLLTHQMMERVLHDHGVEEVRAEGETFNPEFHEAVTQVEVVDRPTGTIAEVLEKGYHHRKTLLRPSKVSVATNVGDTEPSAESSRHASTEDDP
jgi:molecular chaperone GrpE